MEDFANGNETETRDLNKCLVFDGFRGFFSASHIRKLWSDYGIFKNNDN